MPKKVTDELREQLKIECLRHGFTRRGQTYFRVLGDGVLQIIKYEYEHRAEAHELRMGLQSMYGEMYPHWFTNRGCFPKYSVVNLINLRHIFISYSDEHFFYRTTVNTKAQLDILKQKGFDWLDNINTQEKLADAIFYLDKQSGGGPLWHDMEKFNTALVIGNYEVADKVLTTIIGNAESKLNQIDNEYLVSMSMSEEEGEQIRQGIRDRAEPYIVKRKWIEQSDTKTIEKYLKDNYARNCEYAKFCMK